MDFFESIRRIVSIALLRPVCLAIVVFSIGSAAALLPAATTGGDDVDPGFCLIQPSEPASPEIYADYNGRRYYFCCDLCRHDFLADPARFESLATPLERSEDSSANPSTWNPAQDHYAHTFWGRVGRLLNGLHAIGSWCYLTFHWDDLWSRFLVIASVTTMMIWIAAWLRFRRRGQRVPAAGRITVVVALLGGLCLYAAHLRGDHERIQNELVELSEQLASVQQQHDRFQDHDAIHYATFHNFGDPPLPRPTNHPPRLERTYYRGNDERSELMFNGGNYRTVTFELWIQDHHGNRIRPGSRVIDESGNPLPLFLAVRFIRSPNTSSGYFTEAYMKRMYVTMQADRFLGRDAPVADRVDWTMTEPERVWQAEYSLPLGVQKRARDPYDATVTVTREVDPSHPHDRHGVVYLVEDRFEDNRVIGGRFHYAIEYHIRVVNGRVDPHSTLWMQATYHGRNFADLQITDEQWLSTDPIPEKPGDRNADSGNRQPASANTDRTEPDRSEPERQDHQDATPFIDESNAHPAT